MPLLSKKQNTNNNHNSVGAQSNKQKFLNSGGFALGNKWNIDEKDQIFSLSKHASSIISMKPTPLTHHHQSSFNKFL